MYSRVLRRGFPKAWPCQPSITCGPDGPTPIRKRPPDIALSVIMVIAAQAGVLAGICMMPAPALIFLVFARTQVKGVTVSTPQLSPDQTLSNPRRSASKMTSISGPPASPLYFSNMPSRMGSLLISHSGYFRHGYNAQARLEAYRAFCVNHF